MLLFSRVFFTFVLLFVAQTSATGWCSPTGCADVTRCTCTPFFTFCDVSTNPQGLCTFTESGLWIIVAGVIALSILLILAIICCCCCWCCKRRKNTKETIYHYAQPYPSGIDAKQLV